jgi:hypothetical protein
MLNLDTIFDYHALMAEQVERTNVVRMAAKHFAWVVVENTNESADQTAAIRKISEASMTAIASIAREGEY